LPDGTLLRQNEQVHIPPKEMAALRLLLEHAGQIVSPRQIREALWGEIHVTADSVPRCISSLRARLECEECIQTVYKRGYRLQWPVHREFGEAEAENLPRLAIVPFANGPNVPEHLGHAIAEETAARLTAARPQIFSMLARDSVFTLAARGLSAQQVGETLKADLVLTGTLHSITSQIRLRAEMVRVFDGTQIWVEDLMAAREGAASLERMLTERLAFRAGSGAMASGTDEGAGTDPEAYNSFLRGRYEWQSLERHRMQEGIRHLYRAAELDPRLLQARVELVRATVAQELFGFIPPRTAAEHIRHIAGTLPPHSKFRDAILPSLGWIAFHVDRDLPSALRLMAQAEHLPFDPWRARMRALMAASRRRFSEASELLQEGLDADPYSPWINASLAWISHLAGNTHESLRQAERCLELAPGHAATCLFGGMILAFNGEFNRADGLAEELARRAPYLDIAIAVHAYVLACRDERAKAREWLERLQWLGRERFTMRSFAAAAYLALGLRDEAIEELRAANADRCPWFFQMVADPRLAALNGAPEFQRIQAELEDMEPAAEVPAETGASAEHAAGQAPCWTSSARRIESLGMAMRRR
jgi:DNA-binding winged helix-turn-helix (wHTH) protein/tetratricopeptide (TPR) repeat protein